MAAAAVGALLGRGGTAVEVGAGSQGPSPLAHAPMSICAQDRVSAALLFGWNLFLHIQPEK